MSGETNINLNSLECYMYVEYKVTKRRNAHSCCLESNHIFIILLEYSPNNHFNTIQRFVYSSYIKCCYNKLNYIINL